tara:strand:- start:412 stop:558 length:147 start_codon:yes stop_codon:yes gene_type:complete
MNQYQPGLDPVIKTFITFAAIIGPIAIAGIILLLKKIETKEPRRIRWK